MMRINMKTIGITGGVGCGKSTVLSLIEKNCRCKIYLADDIANQLKEPGEALYEPIIELLGDDILSSGLGSPIDKNKMASAIFANDADSLLRKVNQLIHPAVRTFIETAMEDCQRSGQYDYFFIEAALLLEERYDEILDEIWYIYSDVPTRRARLKESRGYSDEKIDSIMAKQLSEVEFRSRCSQVIDNNGKLEETEKSIRKALG